MAEEVNPSPAQGTEDATPAVAPTDFREYSRWRSTGELPEQKEEPQSAAADEQPSAKTEPDSETEGTQEQEEKDEPQGDDEGSASKGKGGSRQRRIDKLIRENEELRRQIAGQPVKPQDRPSESQSAATTEPKLEDFQTLEKYQKALTIWILDERERIRKEQEAQTAAQEAIRKEQDGWAKQVKAGQKAHDDFDEVMDMPFPKGSGVPAARQALLEEENGAEILYYLGKHPKELERIAGLPPASAAAAIGKLAVSFSSLAPENGKPRLTGAPKPPPPSGRPAKTSSDSLEAAAARGDFPAYARLREAQTKR
jgi:hypothetical protein